MGETGILAPDARVELIDGEIFDMAPIGSSHAGTVARLCRLLGMAVGNAAIVWPQNPVILGSDSAPQPDIALLRPRQDFYTASHPRPDDVLLLIEVSDTTLQVDRTVKVRLYATAGIVEYWIVDLEHCTVEVYREPRDGEYRAMTSVTGTGTLAVQSLDVSIAASSVF